MERRPVLLDGIPNPGGRLYPAAVCLQTILDSRGDHYPIHVLENVSLHPYGWFYLNTLKAGVGRAVCMTPGTEMTNSVKVALDHLGYDHEHFLSDDWTETWQRIVAALEAGEPLIFGPLAYRALSYQRTAWRAPSEASHYVVLVGREGDDTLYFHDPNGYSYVRFPADALRDACNDEVMIPSTARFSLIRVGARRRFPSHDELVDAILLRCGESFADRRVRHHGYRGVLALERYTEDLTDCLGAADLPTRKLLFSKMAHYFYPKGNQTRTDAAVFMRDAAARRPELAPALQRFAAAFLEAAVHYAESAAIATAVLVEMSDRRVEEALAPLQRESRAILAGERAAREHLMAACRLLEGRAGAQLQERELCVES